MSALHKINENKSVNHAHEPEGVRRLREVMESQAAPRPLLASCWRKPLFRKGSKVLLGLGLLIGFGIMPARTMLQPASVEAVVNRRIVTLRAPIEGELGGLAAEGGRVLTIMNARADRGRLHELEAQSARRTGQRAALALRLQDQEDALSKLELQSEFFRLGRVEQLAARHAELKALLQAAAARREEAHAAYGRSAALARSGAVSAAELGRLTRERTIADQNEIGVQQQLAAATVELAAAQKGVFIGDSYNDRPSSVQAADEARRRVSDLRSELALADAEIDYLEKEIAAESARYEARASAELKLPAASRIWETLVSPGEQVRAGQDLMRVLDCSRTIVTAAVTERVYNKLTIATAARFIPADGGPELTGVVKELTGPTGIAGNLAISPDALNRKEPYRANVELDEAGAGCAVGRTGKVIFAAEATAP